MSKVFSLRAPDAGGALMRGRSTWAATHPEISLGSSQVAHVGLGHRVTSPSV